MLEKLFPVDYYLNKMIRSFGSFDASNSVKDFESKVHQLLNHKDRWTAEFYKAQAVRYVLCVDRSIFVLV